MRLVSDAHRHTHSHTHTSHTHTHTQMHPHSGIIKLAPCQSAHINVKALQRLIGRSKVELSITWREEVEWRLGSKVRVTLSDCGSGNGPSRSNYR